ncbi:hypothetical protein ACFE04_003368 [Oxalis oulophora]
MDSMMMMNKKQTNNNYIANSRLTTLNKNSQMITKPKPKIRIIHIFAPEIIKTDVANFRELVQRLTGKPPTTTATATRKKQKKPNPINVIRRNELTHEELLLLSSEEPTSCGSNKTVMSTSTGSGGGGFFEMKGSYDHQMRLGLKEEEEDGEVEMWSNGDVNNGGGFLSGFGDFDGFIQELGDFPLMINTSNLHGY